MMFACGHSNYCAEHFVKQFEGNPVKLSFVLMLISNEGNGFMASNK